MKSTKHRALSAIVQLALALTSTCAVAGCSGESAPSDTNEYAATTNGTSVDLSTLQAWLGPKVTRSFNGSAGASGDLVIDLGACAGSDCTAPAQGLLESPLLGTFRYDAQRSGKCEMLEVRMVIREAALNQPSFDGVGLYLSDAGVLHASADTVRRKADAGAVTLANGERGRVLRFAAQGFCFGVGGSTSSVQNRRYEIASFVQFSAGGNTYRNWEPSANHRLGRVPSPSGAFVSALDRQRELLRP